MRMVNSLSLHIKSQMNGMKHHADLAMVEGSLEHEEFLRYQAKAKTSFYYALQAKRRKTLDALIQGLEQLELEM